MGVKGLNGQTLGGASFSVPLRNGLLGTLQIDHKLALEKKVITGKYSFVIFSISLTQLRFLDILGRTFFSSFCILINPCYIGTFDKPKLHYSGMKIAFASLFCLFQQVHIMTQTQSTV